MPRLPDFSGQTVWITGASSGIGEALAREFSRGGAAVILSARRREALEKTASALPRATALPLNLTRPETFPEAVERAYAAGGKIAILVNSAGISQRATALETPLDLTREIMETNFFGPVALTRLVVPRMLEAGGGRVVVISSLMGKFGAPGRSSYAASKHALHGYFDALRAEEWHRGLRVTLVTPGYVRTAISQHARHADGAAHGNTDRGQAAGMAPEKCAALILNGLAQDREEILIGGKEKFAVFAKRWAPKILSRCLRGRNID